MFLNDMLDYLLFPMSRYIIVLFYNSISKCFLLVKTSVDTKQILTDIDLKLPGSTKYISFKSSLVSFRSCPLVVIVIYIVYI